MRVEYFNDALSSYLIEDGIIQQTSYLNTPQ